MPRPGARARGRGEASEATPSSQSDIDWVSSTWVRIPKDQQELLDKPSAWSEELKRNPRGPVNIPASVLQYLEEFHAKLADCQRQSTPTDESPPRPKATALQPRRTLSRAASGSGAVGPATPLVQNHGSPLSASLESSPGTPLSWESSPSRERQPAGPANPSFKAGSPATRQCSTTEWPTQPPALVTKLDSPVREPDLPGIRGSPAALAEPRPDNPDSTSFTRNPRRQWLVMPPMASSSVGNSEDEMELVPPVACGQPPKMTINRLAQPGPTPPSAQVIPCSYRQTDRSDGPPPPKRRALMRGLDHFNWAADEAEQDPLPARKSSAPVDESGPARKTLRASLPSAELRPFEQFLLTYADYGGDLSTFLRACLCIEYLQTRCELPVFLYDDFIRAFKHGYLPYIESASEESSILPAIKWYNRNTAQPMYQKSVINSTVLARILETYSADIAAIRAGLGGTQSQQVDVNEDSAPCEIPVDERHSEEEHEPLEDVEQAGDMPIVRAVGSPDLTSPHPVHTSSRIQEFDDPFEDVAATEPDVSELARTVSSQPSVIIPNTSRSILESNPTRIPETVRKPKPQAGPRRQQRKSGTGLAPSDPSALKIRKSTASKVGENKLRQSLREHMMKHPHPRLASSRQT